MRCGVRVDILAVGSNFSLMGEICSTAQVKCRFQRGTGDGERAAAHIQAMLKEERIVG